ESGSWRSLARGMWWQFAGCAGVRAVSGNAGPSWVRREPAKLKGFHKSPLEYPRRGPPRASPCAPIRTHGRSNGKLEQSVAREELKWQNIDADDLPAEEILRRDG